MTAYAKYVSKDFSIEGSTVRLDKEYAWNHIDKRMRTAIRKAQSYHPVIQEVAGTKDDIAQFYPFCPNREDLPEAIDPRRQTMYCAYIEGRLVGGTIIVRTGGRLFLHFNAVNDEGREKQISSLLLWHVIETFSGSEYTEFDVGASYKPKLQKFFSGWRTSTYPIIMRAPEYKPQLLINPFDNATLAIVPDPVYDVRAVLEQKFSGKPYTFFPRAMYAIFSLFRFFALEGILTKDDEVCIKTTTGSPYISSCVTSAIEQSCKWNREITPQTKVIVVIHEFGFVYKDIETLRAYATANNIILVEDCAYAWNSGKAGSYGDYVIYSVTKYFPTQFGGFLVGKEFAFDYMWQNFACADLGKEDVVMRQLSHYLKEEESINTKRRDNYVYASEILGVQNTFFPLGEKEVPGAFVMKVENEDRMKEISAFVRSFGVECGNYYYNNAIFFPIHQNLGRGHLDYILGAIRAQYREGSGLEYLKHAGH